MTNVTTMKRQTVKVHLVPTNFHTRWPCHVCGGTTDKVSILAEVQGGKHDGFRVCERCICDGDVNQKLHKRADQLRSESSELLSLVGRLEVPSWREYCLAELRHEAEYLRCVHGQDAMSNLAAGALVVLNDPRAAPSPLTRDDVVQAYGVTVAEVEAAQRRIVPEHRKTDLAEIDHPF